MELERLGPYQIVGKLGRGGMGTVFEGVHRETGEPAAIKLLSASLAHEEGFRNRFEAEIETLRKLNHPNIVRLFGFGEQGDLLFYAMELVDGNSLEEELRRGRHFDWREVARIGIETCRALRHAHDRGIIHRDIKPGNLLLANDSRVKLSDFGIARLFGYTRLTSAGSVLGTAEYMAPEQAEGRPVDARADLYSLGALLYALLARRPVFRGKSLPEMLHMQRFQQPESVRRFAPDTPDELDQILAQLLEKDPNRRIANADILARRLESMMHALSLGDETIAADPGWFLQDQPSEASAPAVPPLPEDGVPATLELDPSTDLPMTTMASRLQTPPPADKNAATPAPPAAAAPSIPLPERFTPVSEDELDRIEDEDRPATFSWQTGILAVALLLIGLFAWWTLQPPSADSLYERIMARTANGALGAILEAEDDIREFLSRYPDDPRTAQVRQFEKEINLRQYQIERQFEPPLKRTSRDKDLKPIERAYWEALNYLHLDPELGIAKLQALVALYEGSVTEADPQYRCLVLAKRRLARLQEETKKQVAEQLAEIENRLSAADALRPRDPQRAATIYRAILELYGNKPWAAEAVRRAQQALSLPATPADPRP